MTAVNAYGMSIDFSWFSLISSIISIIGILLSASITVEPIQEQTNKFVAFVAFVGLFLFRMLAWLILITMLHSFSFFVLVGLAVLNWITLLLSQKELVVSPLEHSLLSLVFPAYKWPDAELTQETSLRLFFSLVILGNGFFGAILIALSCLYYFAVTNPWCSEVRIMVHEDKLSSIFFAMIVLFIAATVPTVICYMPHFNG